MSSSRVETTTHSGHEDLIRQKNFKVSRSFRQEADLRGQFEPIEGVMTDPKESLSFSAEKDAERGLSRG
jgi:hypothetical protein